ncbi:MAG TPA: hypothetical protein VK698_36730 [Kofleriaceae bacterium]|nr:hypothetical protein [Kofleriaceae bacterium]
MVAGQKGSGLPAVDNPPLSTAAEGLVVHVGFSTKGGWLSRGIRWFTGSRASHCFVVYRSDVFNQEMVLEASGNGFRIISWRRWDKGNKLIALYRLQMPEPDLRVGLQQLSNRLGDAFDKLSLIGFALQRWFRLKHVPFNSREKLVCSEAVALFLHWCGIPIPDVSVVAPQDLLHLAEHRKDVFELVDYSAIFPRIARRIARSSRRLSGQVAAGADPPLVG